jgi:hypothetical protein
MGFDDARRETIAECVRAFLDACVELRNEVEQLPPGERERAAYRRFHILDEILRLNADVADEIRAQVVHRARETKGEEFATWVAGVMGPFPRSTRTPPVSSKRTRK